MTRERGQDNLPRSCSAIAALVYTQPSSSSSARPVPRATGSSMGTVRIYFGKRKSSSHYWPFGASFGSRVPFFSFTHSGVFLSLLLGAIEHSAIYQHLLSIAPLLLCAQVVLNENRRPWAKADLRITRQKNGENRENRKRGEVAARSGVRNGISAIVHRTHVPQ